MVELSSMVVPGVKFVAKLAGKIPGYKRLAKIGVGRNTVKAARNTAGTLKNRVTRGVKAVRNGAVVVGRTSRTVVRGTRKGFNRVRRFFGAKSRKQRSRKSKPRSVRRSARRSARRNTRKSINRKVQFAPNVRNTANAKPIERELTPMPAVAAPAVAPMAAKPFPVKALNSPVGVAVGNMSVTPKPY